MSLTKAKNEFNDKNEKSNLCQIIKQRLHKNHNLYNLNNKFVSLAILLGNRMCIPYLFF